MCGIFGGVNVTLEESSDAINAIKRGEDGITVKKINNDIIFAARRHLVKKSGKENNNNQSDQPYFSNDKNSIYNLEKLNNIMKYSPFSSVDNMNNEMIIHETLNVYHKLIEY